MIRSFACALGVLSLSGIVAAAPLSVDLPLLERPVRIDGKLDAEEIKGALKLDMTRVGSLDKPADPTSVYVSASQQGIYVAFDCTDRNPTAARALITAENGPVFQDDSVQIFLCPKLQADARNYVHFAVNANGIKYSNKIDIDRPVAGWQAAAADSSAGYTAEVLIPLNAFGGDLRSNFWRANFVRRRGPRGSDKEELSAWQDPGGSVHNYRRFGYLQVTKNIAKGKGPTSIAAAKTGATLSAPTSPSTDATTASSTPAPAPADAKKPTPQPTSKSAASKPAPQAIVLKPGDKEVVINSVPEAARMVVIKEIRSVFNLSLADAKAATESAGKAVGGKLDAEVAKQVADRLRAAGADVVVK